MTYWAGFDIFFGSADGNGVQTRDTDIGGGARTACSDEQEIKQCELDGTWKLHYSVYFQAPTSDLSKMKMPKQISVQVMKQGSLEYDISSCLTHPQDTDTYV